MSCNNDESFLGYLKRIGVRCHQTSMMRRLFQRYILFFKCPVARQCWETLTGEKVALSENAAPWMAHQRRMDVISRPPISKIIFFELKGGWFIFPNTIRFVFLVFPHHHRNQVKRRIFVAHYENPFVFLFCGGSPTMIKNINGQAPIKWCISWVVLFFKFRYLELRIGLFSMSCTWRGFSSLKSRCQTHLKKGATKTNQGARGNHAPFFVCLFVRLVPPLHAVGQMRCLQHTHKCIYKYIYKYTWIYLHISI